MDPGWLEVCSDGYVSVVAWAVLRVVNATEPLVEQVVETLVNVVRLTHDDRVAFNGRVADSTNGVDLLKLTIAREVAAHEHPGVVTFQDAHGK